MLNTFASSKTGRIIISIILGLGISALFRKVCNDRNCLIIKGPPIGSVINNVYNFEDKCYKYRVKAVKCDK